MILSNPKSLAALTLGTALAGCGGGGTTLTFLGPIQANGLPYATNQTVQTSTLSQADSIIAKDSRVAFANGTVLSSGNSEVSFEVLDASTIILTSGGNTWRLENQGSSSSGDVWIAIRNQNGNPSNLSATFGQYDPNDPNSFQSIFFGNIQELPNVSTGGAALTGNTFAISGFETDPAEIGPLSANATYTGEAVVTSDETDGSGNPRLLIDNGTMNVSVNYGGSNTVSGTIQGTASGFGGGTLVLDVNSTNIGSNTNSFTASVGLSGSSTNTNVTALSNGSTLTGTLYGADAAEMGVLLNGTAQTTTDGSVGFAGFGLGKR